MRFRSVVAAAVLAALLVAPGAFAAPRDVAIFVTRLGGDSASAQPYIDKFLRYLESAVGWPAASAKGAFLTAKKDALAFVSATQPGLGILDPPLYFEQRSAWKLQPVLQIQSRDLVSKRYHVVVKDPSITSLAGLKGKRLWTTLGDSPRYLSKVVLAGQADASDFTIKAIGQALKGVRAVLRGDCDATILDDDQLAEAKKISGGGDLRSVYDSPALPPVVVVIFGSGLPAADRDAMIKTLTAMCGSAQGGPICKEMHIEKFLPVDKAAFDDAQQRYGE